MSGKTVYDAEGYMVLVPRGAGAISGTPSKVPKIRSGVGQHRLIKAKPMSDQGIGVNSRRLMISSEPGLRYTVNFAPKAWQYKAWRLISPGIDLDATSPFSSKRGVSDRMKHVIRIGVAMKVKAANPTRNTKYKSKPVVGQIVPKNNPHGIYLVGYDSATMEDLFNAMYDMVYTKLDSYAEALRKMGYANGVYIMKAMVIYDDKTVDVMAGDPRNFFEHMGLKFTSKGFVIL